MIDGFKLKDNIEDELLLTTINNINNISIDIFNGATSAFKDLGTMRMLIINVRLECSRLSSLSTDAAALNEIGNILQATIDKIEIATAGGRDAAKAIGSEIRKIKE